MSTKKFSPNRELLWSPSWQLSAWLKLNVFLQNQISPFNLIEFHICYKLHNTLLLLLLSTVNYFFKQFLKEKYFIFTDTFLISLFILYVDPGFYLDSCSFCLEEFTIPCTGILVMNFLSFCMPGKIFILTTFSCFF